MTVTADANHDALAPRLSGTFEKFPGLPAKPVSPCLLSTGNVSSVANPSRRIADAMNCSSTILYLSRRLSESRRQVLLARYVCLASWQKTCCRWPVAFTVCRVAAPSPARPPPPLTRRRFPRPGPRRAGWPGMDDIPEQSLLIKELMLIKTKLRPRSPTLRHVPKIRFPAHSALFFHMDCGKP